jgi:hypothetical protein
MRLCSRAHNSFGLVVTIAKSEAAWHLPPHLKRGLILARSFIDHLAQRIVLRPGEKLDLDNELGPHPMHAAGHEGQAEAPRVGGASSGIRVVASGCSRRHRRSSSAVSIPVTTRPA